MAGPTTPPILPALAAPVVVSGRVADYRSGFKKLLLIGGAALLLLMAVWAALFTLTGSDSIRVARIVSQDSSAMVIGVEKLTANLSHTDAILARAQLASPADRAAMTKTAIAQIRDAQSLLLSIAAARPYDSGYIDRVSRSIVDYALYTGIAGTEATAEANKAALAADTILRNGILPDLKALGESSRFIQNHDYHALQDEQTGKFRAAIAAFLAVVGGLCFYQFQIFKHSARLLNLAMVAATLVILAGGAYAIYDLEEGRARLRFAKETALDSLDLLLRMKAAANEADALVRFYALKPEPKPPEPKPPEPPKQEPVKPADPPDAGDNQADSGTSPNYPLVRLPNGATIYGIGPVIPAARPQRRTVVLPRPKEMWQISAPSVPAKSPEDAEIFRKLEESVDDRIAAEIMLLRRDIAPSSGPEPAEIAPPKPVSPTQAHIVEVENVREAWRVYCRVVDAYLTQQAGKQKSAAELQGMNEAFAVFSGALDKEIESGRKAYDFAVVEVNKSVSEFAEWSTLGAWFAATVLLSYGAWLRLREYEL